MIRKLKGRQRRYPSVLKRRTRCFIRGQRKLTCTGVAIVANAYKVVQTAARASARARERAETLRKIDEIEVETRTSNWNCGLYEGREEGRKKRS